jgi:hypothetical protein
VNTALPSTSDSIDGSEFSPDAKALAYFGEQETSNVSEVYVVGLTTTASAWRKVNTPLGAGGSAYGVQWSRDSSRLGFLVRAAASTGVTLHVVDVMNGAAVGKAVTTSACATSTSCREVISFKFQP